MTIDIISSDLVCPSCGHKGAIIENMNRTISLYHEFCGYRIPINDFVLSFFSSQKEKAAIDIKTIINRELHVASSSESTVITLKRLLSNTNGYFRKFHFTLIGKLSKANCPICAKALKADFDNFICPESHFKVAPNLYFETFIVPPFKINVKADRPEWIYTVSCEKQSSNPMISTDYEDIATVTYRYHNNKNERVLLVDCLKINKTKSYQNFLKLLKEKGSQHFKIIEKIHSK